MSGGELVARICITALIVISVSIAAIAARSALAKWRQAQLNRTTAEKIVAIQYEADKEFAAGNENAHHESMDKIRALGVELPTYATQFANEVTHGGLRPGAFEARREVLWGLVALSTSTVAGIWDVWL